MKVKKPFKNKTDGQDYYVAITRAIDHAGTGTLHGFFLDKLLQQAPNRRRVDERRDVFDEVMPLSWISMMQMFEYYFF
jgi:hypothetical protein